MISPEQFSCAYSTGFEIVQKTLMRRGVKPMAAEEISQAAWARAWEKQEMFQGRSTLLTWVTRIAFNLFLQQARRPEIEVQVADYFKSSYMPPTEAFVDASVILSKCPRNTATVLRLRYLEDKDFDEIGRANMGPRGARGAMGARLAVFRARLVARRAIGVV